MKIKQQWHAKCMCKVRQQKIKSWYETQYVTWGENNEFLYASIFSSV